jgi:hypothetical protein
MLAAGGHGAVPSPHVPFVEVHLKTTKSLPLVLALAFSSVVPATAAPTCLYTYQIDRTRVVDQKTIDFRMRDGTVYRNVLRNSCTSLPFNGFVYTVATDQICDNVQSIRVLQSHEVCVLGAFTRMPGAKVDVGH